ncbi:MAG: hypothetical protein KHZ95_02800 [Eubacterium sp.]|nr:hypothetical protein [Eubacterium sp.]
MGSKKILAASKEYSCRKILVFRLIAFLIFISVLFILGYLYVDNIIKYRKSLIIFCLIIEFVAVLFLFVSSVIKKSYIIIYDGGVYGSAVKLLFLKNVKIDININDINDVFVKGEYLIIDSKEGFYKFFVPRNGIDKIRKEILKQKKEVF